MARLINDNIINNNNEGVHTEGNYFKPKVGDTIVVHNATLGQLQDRLIEISTTPYTVLAINATKILKRLLKYK